MPTVKLSLTILRSAATPDGQLGRGNPGNWNCYRLLVGSLANLGREWAARITPSLTAAVRAPEIARSSILHTDAPKLRGLYQFVGAKLFRWWCWRRRGWRRRWWLVIKLMLIETSFNHKDSVVCCASKPGQLKRRVVYLRPEEFKQTLLSVSQM